MLAEILKSAFFSILLGSTRLVTNGSTWQQLQCFDYLPFGEEIPAGTAGRSSCFPSGVYPINPRPDLLAQKFTSKERDPETGMDFFGARYFSGAQGRFTSPDDPLLDQYAGDPQSWKLYSYVRNNPLKFVDPNGNDCIYKNTFDEKARTVVVQTGSCTVNGGTYVPRTISSITYDANSHSLDYGYTAYKGGTVSVGSIALPNPDPGIQALQRGVLGAAPGVKAAGAGIAAVMAGTAVGIGYGAVTGGTALIRLGIAAIPVLSGTARR